MFVGDLLSVWNPILSLLFFSLLHSILVNYFQFLDSRLCLSFHFYIYYSFALRANISYHFLNFSCYHHWLLYFYLYMIQPFIECLKLVNDNVTFFEVFSVIDIWSFKLLLAIIILSYLQHFLSFISFILLSVLSYFLFTFNLNWYF